MGTARKDLARLNHQVLEDKVTDDSLRTKLKVAEAKEAEKEKELEDKEQQAVTAAKDEKERLAIMKKDEGTKVQEIEAMKSTAAKDNANRELEDKLEVAHRKEM